MYQRILVPIDGSETSDRGAAEALSLAKAFGSTVRFFHVIDLSPVLRASEGAVMHADSQPQRLREEGERVVAAALAKARNAGVQAESGTAEIIANRPAEEIRAEIERARPDLVVMGTHGRRGLSRAMLGSDAEYVARRSTVPVMLVPRPAAT